MHFTQHMQYLYVERKTTLQKEIEREHTNEGRAILCSWARKLYSAKMSLLIVIYGVSTMPSKIPADFHGCRTWQADCKPYMEIQMTSGNRNHFEKKTSWRIHAN